MGTPTVEDGCTVAVWNSKIHGRRHHSVLIPTNPTERIQAEPVTARLQKRKETRHRSAECASLVRRSARQLVAAHHPLGVRNWLMCEKWSDILGSSIHVRVSIHASILTCMYVCTDGYILYTYVHVHISLCVCNRMYPCLCACVSSVVH